jgi:cytoskeletal protein CcmA (bactofilin family)
MSIFGNRRQPEPALATTTPKTPTPTVALPPAAPQPVGFETVLGANTVVEGTLRSNSNVRLDGTFTGTLEISGNVLVGETAKITADIHAKNVSIAGAVRGNVSGNKVQILRTGRIWGDIHALKLTTEEGAFIDGKISMGSRDMEDAPVVAAAEAAPELPVDAPVAEAAAETAPAETVETAAPASDVPAPTTIQNDADNV